jgi:DNA-binding MarR family transcriptional regulator
MRAPQQVQMVTAQWLQTVAGVVLHNAAVAARLGLGVNDVQVLGLIQQAGRITPGELARSTGVSTESITGVADRLVAAGYATRTRDEPDRSKVYLGADPVGIAPRRSGAELAIIGDFLADLNDLDGG